MSDLMRPIPFGKLMNWIFAEVRGQGSVFGVPTLYRHDPNAEKLPLFQGQLESPFGPAAGPHTQLAQNIIAAYCAGSRFFELKTVQKLDGEDLPVEKPCITAADECYNCEWSTELRIPEAFDEYVKAWFAIKLLSRELSLGNPDGFIFNMSVGYDFEGIQSPKINDYIEDMKEAADTAAWQACKDWTMAHLDLFEHIDAAFVAGISSQVSESITLSTLHGCPPAEIERIATYLITEKHLNTYIKCNPTLLGYDYTRKTMDDLGYDYMVFDGHHFTNDLQFSDAIPMFKRLSKLTMERGLEFGVKLTNTFPVKVTEGELPSEEMYMSGRALFPLSLSVAKQISEAMEGKLRISYSGGADAYNIKALFDTGIWPITLATTLLKPGGYQRIAQLAQVMEASSKTPFTGVNAGAVATLLADSLQDDYYRKPIKPIPPHKMKEQVSLVDCFQSPCRSGCPIEQDIPAYLQLVGEEKYAEALQVITTRNPLPFITGTICPHHCADKCLRGFYEDSVHIRASKLQAAEGGFEALLASLSTSKITSEKRVAVVGGGPAGLSAAAFLARSGVAVTIFERRQTLGGIVSIVIPEFRISHDAIEKDITLVRAMGAEIKTGVEITSVQALRDQGFTDIILACGAWKPGRLDLEYGETMNVLTFLETAKQSPETLTLGENVVIIGGGNTAMDAARAAKRVKGVKEVSIVYRRNKRYMPADEEELALSMADGVNFCELLSPVGHKDGKLTCQVMALGEPDASGRRRPEPTGAMQTVPADTVIAAIGEQVDTAFYTANGVDCDNRGKAIVTDTLWSASGKVYVIGDANRGPATVVEGIADAMKAANAITAMCFDGNEAANINPDYAHAATKKGTLDVQHTASEAQRCLECATVCECCVDVCPNRANITVAVEGLRARQIVHIDGMCNECGNCETFCPYTSAPYRDKFTLFWSEGDFESSDNSGFLALPDGRVRIRLDGGVQDTEVEKLPQQLGKIVSTVLAQYSYVL